MRKLWKSGHNSVNTPDATGYVPKNGKSYAKYILECFLKKFFK